MKGASQIERLENPLKQIQIKNYEQKIDLEKFGEEYVKLKEEIKIKNKEEWKIRYQNLNTILTQYKLNDENWYKINKILLSEHNKKFLKNSEIDEKMINDFKNLYGHEKGRKFDLNKTLNIIYQILQNLKEKSYSINNMKLYNPKSKAYDYNGFSQRQIINYIKDDVYINQIDKFSYIIMLLSNNNSIDKLIHPNIKILFIKKKIDADELNDLRPISILPAWVIVLEKLAKPLIDKIVENKISKAQFGFKSGSDCGIAKTMILYKCRKYNYNKSLLIDIKKAYDSVNRDILKNIISKNFGETGKILIDFISIYDGLTTIINGKAINNIYGLPQGSAISPILFNLYINEALEKINQINNLSAQAYADDLILQSTSLESLQIGFNTVKALYNELNLKINSNKCELILEVKEDSINDIENNIKIKSQSSAKYLGQIINQN